MKNTVTQYIKCPNCSTVQSANVELGKGQTFDTYIHSCGQCGHVIMESEWDKVPAPRLDTIAEKMAELLEYLQVGIGIRKVKPKKAMLELAEDILKDLNND